MSKPSGNKHSVPKQPAGIKPGKRVFKNYPSSTMTNVEQRKARVDQWESFDDPEEEALTRSRFLLQKAMEARERLAQDKRAKAQTIRNESTVFTAERRAKVAEDQAWKIFQSQLRMSAWELEHRHRESDAEKRRRIRQASEYMRKEELLAIARNKEKEELDHLRHLKEQMLEIEARRYLPPTGAQRFSGIEPHYPTLAQTLFKLDGQHKQEAEELKARRREAYYQQLEKMKVRHVRTPPARQGPPHLIDTTGYPQLPPRPGHSVLSRPELTKNPQDAEPSQAPPGRGRSVPSRPEPSKNPPGAEASTKHQPRRGRSVSPSSERAKNPPGVGLSVPPGAGHSVPPVAGSSVPPGAGHSVPPVAGSSVPPGAESSKNAEGLEPTNNVPVPGSSKKQSGPGHSVHPRPMAGIDDFRLGTSKNAPPPQLFWKKKAISMDQIQPFIMHTNRDHIVEKVKRELHLLENEPKPWISRKYFRKK